MTGDNKPFPIDAIGYVQDHLDYTIDELQNWFVDTENVFSKLQGENDKVMAALIAEGSYNEMQKFIEDLRTAHTLISNTVKDLQAKHQSMEFEFRKLKDYKEREL
ncbi:hypothetical protein F4212_06370 [Candidatus Poribacteria bacterium]|nr:hypothetical protein [Candidatus Poribacteria bacterium]